MSSRRLVSMPRGLARIAAASLRHANGTFFDRSRYPFATDTFSSTYLFDDTCENSLTVSSQQRVFLIMRDIYYIDAVVDVETEPLPVWLEDRLKQLFGNLSSEPLPQSFFRLLRQLEDDDESPKR